jgi:biopolymer transport protein ExbD
MKLESHLPRQSPWLYIAPLLNAILLLLVYFLFSSGFIVQSGITVNKPQSSSRLSGFDRAHVITVAPGPSGPVYFDGKRVTLGELEAALLGAREGERKAIVHADAAASHGRVVNVSDLALSLGFEVAHATAPPVNADLP